MKASSDENFQNNMLEQLYDAYEYKMYGIAYSILNNVGQAEDAVQDAFIKLIPHLGEINSVASIGTKRLITYTIKNIAIDIYHRNSKEAELFTKGVDEPVISENQQGIDYVKTVDGQIIK